MCAGVFFHQNYSYQIYLKTDLSRLFSRKVPRFLNGSLFLSFFCSFFLVKQLVHKAN